MNIALLLYRQDSQHLIELSFVFLGYVCFLMVANCIAFNIIVSCYMKMYCSIRGSQVWNSNDTRIAKRMALLVFTDFVCWAPISFFSLTAAFGHDLISLDDAKVFTIFVLPFNSCANPFLYAIFTKQFKKNCNILCKRLKRSRMSKSLSRLSNRGGGFNFGSSRRLSALNSFFTGDRSRSRNRSKQPNNRSISISGASAPPRIGSRSSGTGRGSGSIVYIKKSNENKHGLAPEPAVNYRSISNCLPNTIIYNDDVHGGKRRIRNDRNKPPRDGRRKEPKRGQPVGVGSNILSMLKTRKGDRGDGKESDHEDSSWAPNNSSSFAQKESSSWSKRESSSWSRNDTSASYQDPLGVRALLKDSPSSVRRPNSSLHSELSSSVVTPKVHHIRPTSLPSNNTKKSVTLNCCNTSSSKRPGSPGPEYQIMWPTDESGYDGTQGSSNKNDTIQSDEPEKLLLNGTADIMSDLREAKKYATKLLNGGAPLALEEEDSSGVDVDDIRLEPEGAENRPASRPDRLDLVKAIVHRNPSNRTCNCNGVSCSNSHNLELSKKTQTCKDPVKSSVTSKPLSSDIKRHNFIRHKSNSFNSDIDSLQGAKANTNKKFPSHVICESKYSCSLPSLDKNIPTESREDLGQPVGYSPHITSFHLRTFLDNGPKPTASDDVAVTKTMSNTTGLTENDMFDAAEKVVISECSDVTVNA